MPSGCPLQAVLAVKLMTTLSCTLSMMVTSEVPPLLPFGRLMKHHPQLWQEIHTTLDGSDMYIAITDFLQEEWGLPIWSLFLFCPH